MSLCSVHGGMFQICVSLAHVLSAPTGRKCSQTGCYDVYVFADCVDWVELLSAKRHVFYSHRMSLRTASTELKCCRQGDMSQYFSSNVFYSCRMSLRTASTELKCCRQGDIFYNSFEQMSPTVVACLCGLRRRSPSK